MKNRRKIILVAAILAIGVIGWIAHGWYRTITHIPEAYAAWDTGTLLVEYLKTHDDRWPSSWDDLLTVLDSQAGQKILLRGARAGDMPYARSLREKVAVDWTFAVSRPQEERPVTRLDGSAFTLVWEGAEPNEMVQWYLKERASTRPSRGP
jgi:hypothetical protein